MQHFLVFGSHPLLSAAEAKAVIGMEKPKIIEQLAVFATKSWDETALNNRLGGTVKLGEVIATVSVSELTAERLADEMEARPRADKIQFGFTLFGGSAEQKQKTKHLPIELKRTLQQRGHSVRWVTGEDGALSPAAVAKLDLMREGYDLVIGFFGDEAVVGLTTKVQDADAWSLRDFGRPFRDMETGMLPPKLARMMVNLVGPADNLLDPFCGGGTVLMEAALVGVKRLYGSDIDKKQVMGTKQNLDWMVEKGLMEKETRHSIDIHTRAAEKLEEHFKPGSIDAIVTEGYLGKPLRGNESLPFLHQQKQAIEKLWHDSLRTFSQIQKPGGKIVCVWPVFVTSQATAAVDLKNDLADLGYRLVNPLEDWKEKSVTLTYARADQHVKRNIIILERI